MTSFLHTVSIKNEKEVRVSKLDEEDGKVYIYARLSIKRKLLFGHIH